MFTNKTLLITGGTGSFGSAILEKLLNSSLNEIRIFSRDEKKQDDLRKKFYNPKIKFYIGDVRDRLSLDQAMRNVDYVFHAAALKQVPSCEFYPMEAFKTNVLGTENVLESAIFSGVKKVICLSTDKAVYPINSMGISKAMMEKVMVATSRNLSISDTTICCTRYGNVMASRGSVIPLFVNQILENKPITVTDFEMTRFMMTLEDAVELVLYAFQHGSNGEIYIQKSPAASLKILIQALLELFKKNDHAVTCIGARHGEKLFEVLLSREEKIRAKDHGDYFCILPDTRDLNYEKFINKGDTRLLQKSNADEFHSHNAIQLDKEEMKKLLMRLDFIKHSLQIGYY